MLILTRRPQEVIVIGDDVQVTILEVRGNQVRIGIDAPYTTPVHRKEVAERIRAEKEDTARRDAGAVEKS